MQVSDNKFLGWRLHCEILEKIKAEDNLIHMILCFNRACKGFLLTKGGNSFSAALRGTEKPPCVLVSLAVKILQKNSLGCLLGFSPKSGTGKTSFS